MSDDDETMSVGSRGGFRHYVHKMAGRCDTSFSMETEASIRDMKETLLEVQEKYRKAMVSNARLHNDKSTLMYQVETLKEELSDMEELLWESQRHRDYTSKALERQREISDIVGIDRDRLRDEVVRLTNLLKKHRVVVTPEVSTNRETRQGKDEDDVSAGSVTRLAQELSGGGRESMLGQVQEQLPAEGSSIPQDDGDRSKADTLKPVRTLDRHTREIRDTVEKVYKSRLFPPRPAEDVILNKKPAVLSIVAAAKQVSQCQEKQKQDAASAMGNGSSDRDAGQKPPSVIDQIFKNQGKDGNSYKDMICSRGDVVPLGTNGNDINDFSPPTSVNTFVTMSEIHDEGCEGSTSFVAEPDGQSDPMGRSCSEEFVLVVSSFVEPAKTKIVGSGSDRDSTRSPDVAKINEQRRVFHRSESCLVSIEETVEMQLERHRMVSTSSHGQRSKVRRLMEITADEIKAMAAPELVLVGEQEGRLVEPKSTGWSSEGLQQLSAGDMDSCEEVDEDDTQVIAEDVQVPPDQRGGKGKDKTDCKIL